MTILRFFLKNTMRGQTPGVRISGAVGFCILRGLAAVCVCLALVACESRAAESAAARSREAAGGAAAPRRAVSNSWLECALRDLAPEAPAPLRVCPPGMCPGHFDLRPGMVKELRRSELFLLFDFQQAMGGKLEGLSSSGLKVVPVSAPEGLCVPSSYLSGLEAVSEALIAASPARREAVEAALARARERLARLEAELQGAMDASGLRGAKVVTSGHQAVFCRWLGLEVIGGYSGPETLSPARLEALFEEGRESGVRFVIANAQENAQMGEVLAARLEAPLVMFSNFPAMTEAESTFDSLARGNVARLLAAAAASAPGAETAAPVGRK